MSGHSKWSTIKHQKAATDAKRSQIFSKMAKMITVAARKGDDPDMNPDLRAAIDKAKGVNMPADNIERAIKKGAGKLEGAQMENVRYEAYGPGGVAIIIEAITDNNNRTVAEIKHILSKNNGKFAESGSVTWAFENAHGKWEAKHKIEISEEDAGKLDRLLEALDDNDDVQNLFVNSE
ncbi:MAG: YebC/PmpR family DNA-binding transcriptional regulator [bacterium]|nr:YebC/PmpR family DNA-binding transcriptional regulator [bacterium]